MRESKVIFGTVLVGVLSLVLIQYENLKKRQFVCDAELWEDYEENEFEGFDNETGVQTGQLIVPNHIHFLRMGPNMKVIKFIDAMCLLAAFKKQKPDRIFIHTDQNGIRGRYWKYLMNDVPGFKETITFMKAELPESIFNQTLSKDYYFYHSSDILRIQILMQYGGIFLDNDSFLVKSLDPYRKFEMVLGWDEGEFLGTQVLLAHNKARFLNLWLESYRNHYYPNLWYFNAGEWPTVSILWSRPELVHRVRLLFGVHDLRYEMVATKWPEWKNQYAIHLLTRHLNVQITQCLLEKYDDAQDITEAFVRKYPNALRDMIQEIYEFDPDIKVNTVDRIPQCDISLMKNW